MPAIPLRAMVPRAPTPAVCSGTERCSTAAATSTWACAWTDGSCGSLDQGYPYDYCLCDGFRLDQGCRGTLAMLGQRQHPALPAGGRTRLPQKRLLFEVSEAMA